MGLLKKQALLRTERSELKGLGGHCSPEVEAVPQKGGCIQGRHPVPAALYWKVQAFVHAPYGIGMFDKGVPWAEDAPVRVPGHSSIIEMHPRIVLRQGQLLSP